MSVSTDHHRVGIGVDVGGTFTDVLALDDSTGKFYVAKTLTTPADPTVGVLRAVSSTLEDAGIAPSMVRNVIHGTTLVTNAIIQRNGAFTALLTTRGFRDVLDIAREHRYDMYDLLLELPRPLVSRENRFEIEERTLADGTIHRRLNLSQVDEVADELERRGIRAIAVVFLHSFRNPSHEIQVGARLGELLPGAQISLSHEIAGEIREFERTSTTVANAYVQELLDRYLGSLEQHLRALGFTGRLLIMLSNGGLATADTARRFPVRTIESGPAAGALAAAHAGQLAGRPNLLSFDMGGTTAKACLIEDGRPFTTAEFEVDRIYRFKPGSGLPIKAPAIEMIEIGAGGGSIAHVDRFGLLKVGPESAGASPGPACYGLGGDRPTVTDADLLLGYLNPDFFLGGAMKLDREAASRTIERAVATPLGMSVTAAAWAIHQIVGENMASAARMHAVERGKDVRRYPLFAFGGAGPVHAYQVAKSLRVSQIIAPVAAGVGSTLGFLVAPISFDFVRGSAGLLDQLDWTEVNQLFAAMEADGRALLAQARVASDEIVVRRSCDMRLSGQAHQVSVPIPGGQLDGAGAAAIRHAFDDVYRELFKRATPGVPVEALNWRLNVSGPLPPTRSLRPVQPEDSGPAIKGHRPIYLPARGEFAAVPVYDRYRLAPGARFDGPAVVEEKESTVVVAGPCSVHVDEWSNLVIDLAS